MSCKFAFILTVAVQFAYVSCQITLQEMTSIQITKQFYSGTCIIHSPVTCVISEWRGLRHTDWYELDELTVQSCVKMLPVTLS